MIYVMSDIHGNAVRFNDVMAKIDFQPEDTLYILVDAVDRYTDGFKIIRCELLRRLFPVRFKVGDRRDYARRHADTCNCVFL